MRSLRVSDSPDKWKRYRSHFLSDTTTLSQWFVTYGLNVQVFQVDPPSDERYTCREVATIMFCGFFLLITMLGSYSDSPSGVRTTLAGCAAAVPATITAAA